MGLTWCVGFLIAAIQRDIPDWGVAALYYLGGVMPVAVAAGMVYSVHDRPFRYDFWRRIIDFRRISIGWYVVVLLCTPVKSSLAAIVDILLVDVSETF